MKRFRTAHAGGLALVIVLAFLVLISALILAFFTSISTEVTAARSYAAGVTTRQLSESAVSIVMSQIREATARENGAWATQPGMVRVWRDGSSSSDAADAFFKLYSSDNMVVSKGQVAAFDPADDVPAAGSTAWYKNPALYTDLNQPMTAVPMGGAAGRKVFPIMDPRVSKTFAQTSGALAIDGFDVTGDSQDDRTVSAEEKLGRMPVRWIYVLKDGTLTTPKEAAGDGQVASWSGVTNAARTPSKDNPIAGRIAFWTDDETCKVNVNTAAEGTYFDTPRTFAQQDYDFAKKQPAQREWQRYPGHPAMTCLSPIFLPGKATLTAAEKEDIYAKIVPRVAAGGSKAGTLTMPQASKIVPDKERLYQSVDELKFFPNRDPNPLVNDLEKVQFFATAHSRAPEINLFNQPRLSIWPIHAELTVNAKSDFTTAFDRLIAFCSRIGPVSTAHPFYFQRSEADSSTQDYQTGSRNEALYKYLQRVTGKTVPGFPVAAGGFSGKYSGDRNQILTEIFDYIRTANLYDDTLPVAGKQFTDQRKGVSGTTAEFLKGHGQVTPIKIGDTKGFGRFYTVSEMAVAFMCRAAPKEDAESNDPAKNPIVNTLGTEPAAGGKKKLQDTEKILQAAFLLEIFDPSQGWYGNFSDMQFKVTGLDSWMLDGQSLGFPKDIFLRPSSTERGFNHTGMHHGRAWGGHGGFRTVILNCGGDGYPAIGKPIKVKESAKMNFSGGAVTVEIYAGVDNPPSPSKLVQTLQVTQSAFAANSSLPMPKIVTEGTSSLGTESGSPASHKMEWWSWKKSDSPPKPSGASNWASGSRFSNVGGNPGHQGDEPAGDAGRGAILRTPWDVVRSVVPKTSDYRLLAAQTTPANDLFVSHPQYGSGNNFAHSLREPVSDCIAGMTPAGSLISGVAADFTRSLLPDVPIALSSAEIARGDWDTGVASVIDGPYINKVDDGNGALLGRNPDGTAYPDPNAAPYFDKNEQVDLIGSTHFSPNRKMPSAGMFGSLPTGVKAGVPFQTLLFRPDPTGTHKGGKNPKDHLLLDLFHMPVVEPYAISEPFSTAGKINLNYRLMPFTHIQRQTALLALLKSEQVAAIPSADAKKYKTKSAAASEYRFPIKVSATDGTLRGFEDRFNSLTQSKAGDIFRSASEICDIHLVPEKAGATYSAMASGSFWRDHALTGDNMRERPYTTLYPRLTTKSNTYTVHFRVQTLRQRPREAGTEYAKWEEGKDALLSEYRGSTTIERYLDPEDRRFDKANPETVKQGDFIDVDTEPLEKTYRFRVLLNKKFTP